MKSKRVLAACAVMLALSAANCHAQNARALIGKWFFEDFLGTEMALVEFTAATVNVLELEEDETETYSYQADGKTITIDGDELRYVIQNNISLVMTDSGGNEYAGTKVQANPASLSGRYELANDMGFVETLEFIDKSTVRLHMDLLGRTTRTTHQYRISGSYLIISDPSGSITLEIIGNNLIKGNTFGGIGGDSIFIKR
jgi:hypothetical protein